MNTDYILDVLGLPLDTYLSVDKSFNTYTVWRGSLSDISGQIVFTGRSWDRLYSVVLEAETSAHVMQSAYLCFDLGKRLLCDISAYWATDSWFYDCMENVSLDGTQYKTKVGRMELGLAGIPQPSRMLYSISSGF